MQQITEYCAREQKKGGVEYTTGIAFCGYQPPPEMYLQMAIGSTAKQLAVHEEHNLWRTMLRAYSWANSLPSVLKHRAPADIEVGDTIQPGGRTPGAAGCLLLKLAPCLQRPGAGQQRCKNQELPLCRPH